MTGAPSQAAAPARSSWLADVSGAHLGRVLLVLAAAGFALGGLESLALRAQLSRADAALLDPVRYHQTLTLHGVSMLFLALLPASLGMALALLPARLGGGRSALPRVAAFGAWVWVAGAAVLHLGLLFGGTSDAGMLGNASMTSLAWAPREKLVRGLLEFRASGVDWWATGLALVALGAACVSLEVVATVLRCRAPGRALADQTPFAWNSLMAGMLGLLSLPTLFAGLVLLLLDRHGMTTLFDDGAGGDPGRWARLTALLGHPQVAMLLLPAMGLAAEVVVGAAGRPLVGRSVVRLGSLTLAATGTVAWLAQLSPAGTEWTQAALPVAGTLMALAASSAVFHWIATLWGRPLAASPALLFVLGMAALLMTGAFSTLPLALQPAAARQAGTYFGVAHAHEMLFGGVVLGLTAALYQHLPRLFGRVPDAPLGRLHFALTLLGALVTFLPMHALGLAGMPRRIHTYSAAMGWDGLNTLATAGAVVLLLAGLVFVAALARAKPAGPDALKPGPGPAPVPVPPPSPQVGPALMAFGVALSATGTLLGWLVGLPGAFLLVAGAWRMLGEERTPGSQPS